MVNLKDIGYNHYIVSGKLAGKLAGGKFPKPGYETLVTYEGSNYFLKRDRYQGKNVWVIHGPVDWKHRPEGGMILGNPCKLKNPGLEVANTIYQQIGGRRFAVMTGARNFVGGENFLQFSIPSTKDINKVKIELRADDTYTMKFYKIRGASVKLVDAVRMIYADQLQDIFTSRTGLYTSLGTMRSNPEAPPKGKLYPFHSGKRPGYQNINRRYLMRLIGDRKIVDGMIARQLAGATLADAFHAEERLRAKENPPGRVKIYDRVKEVVAVKGPAHRCDSKCRAAGHTYIHKFRTKNPIWGEPDGSVTIK